MAWGDAAYRIPTDDTSTTYHLPVLYSTRVINHVRANLIAVATTDVTWKSQLAKGTTLYVPKMTTLAPMDVDPQTSFLATADAKTFLTTGTSITISYWKGNPVMIDDSTKMQTQIGNLLQLAADNAKYGLEKAIDTSVNTLYSSLTTTWQGSDGQTFSDDILIALMEGLDEADVPRQDRALIGDPSMIADIYKVDKFMSYDYNQTVFTTDAYRGKINAYNLPVFCTNNLVDAGTGNRGALLQKQAIATVLQSELKTEMFRVPQQYSDCINVSCIYGCGVVRSTFGACFYTRYN